MVKVEVVWCDSTDNINVCHHCSKAIRAVNSNGKVRDMWIFPSWSTVLLILKLGLKLLKLY